MRQHQSKTTSRRPRPTLFVESLEARCTPSGLQLNSLLAPPVLPNVVPTIAAPLLDGVELAGHALQSGVVIANSTDAGIPSSPTNGPLNITNAISGVADSVLPAIVGVANALPNLGLDIQVDLGGIHALSAVVQVNTGTGPHSLVTVGTEIGNASAPPSGKANGGSGLQINVGPTELSDGSGPAVEPGTGIQALGIDVQAGLGGTDAVNVGRLVAPSTGPPLNTTTSGQLGELTVPVLGQGSGTTPKGLGTQIVIGPTEPSNVPGTGASNLALALGLNNGTIGIDTGLTTGAIAASTPTVPPGATLLFIAPPPGLTAAQLAIAGALAPDAAAATSSNAATVTTTTAAANTPVVAVILNAPPVAPAPGGPQDEDDDTGAPDADAGNLVSNFRLTGEPSTAALDRLFALADQGTDSTAWSWLWRFSPSLIVLATALEIRRRRRTSTTGREPAEIAPMYPWLSEFPNG